MSDSVYDYNRRCFELLKKKNIYVEGEDNEFTPFYKRYKRYAIQNHPDKKTLIDEEYDVYKRITSCRNLFLNEDMYNDFIRFNTKPVKTEPDQSEPKYRRRRNLNFFTIPIVATRQCDKQRCKDSDTSIVN
jgi:isochorismate hydrolase